MKTIIPFIALLLASTTICSQEYVNIDSKITDVIVFPDRAQLHREAFFNTGQGKSLLRITGLSPYADPSSMQVRGEGNFTIVSVNTRRNYLEPTEETEEVKKLRTRIEEMKISIEDENTEIGILREKEGFLSANRVVTGKNENISAEEFKNISDLYTSSIESVRKGILTKNRLIKKYEEERQKLESQLNLSLQKSQMPSSEVIISVSTLSPARGKIILNYLVANAGWYPSYDIRVNDIDEDIRLYYKANMHQNTGKEWDNVLLSFSSANPSMSGRLPDLFPWYLNFFAPPTVNFKSARAIARSQTMDIAEDAEIRMYDFEVSEEEEAGAPPVNINRTNTSFSFEVDIPQKIIPDGKINTIELQQLSTKASYKYVAVPKLREEAFLTADIPEWESMNLMNGEANIYFGNTFTGTTILNTGQISDTLNVSLGTDNNITVKRERRKDYTIVRTIGSNRIDSRSFEISIRNNKYSDIHILVYDQLPVSQNKDIEVEATELSGGKLNNITGEVVWDTMVPAGASKAFILTYTVKYPKNQKVILE
ncbi:MAG: mucoidy inhibitor MuiA family protein [Bacteroidales bacterium]|nr:mucoidy inhibitor MuiA family protein [Bacteroidales bacterium]